MCIVIVASNRIYNVIGRIDWVCEWVVEGL